MADLFQISVADYVLIDASTGQAIARGATANTTAMNQTMAKTEVRGGFGNQLLYTYFHDKAVEFNLEIPTFNSYILALQNGTTVTSGTVAVIPPNECHTFGASGSVVLDNVPLGDVTVLFDDNNASVLVTPSGSSVYVANSSGRMAHFIYEYNTTADRITAEGTTQPAVVKLVLTAKVFDASHTNVVQYFQLVVPSFKLDGAYSLSMAGNDASKQQLKGMALLVPASDCATNAYYYTATYINVDETAAPYTKLLANPSPVTFSVASGLPATSQLSVLGYRAYPNLSAMVTSSCTYTKTSGSPAITVSAGGLVTAGSASTAGMIATIDIAYWDASSGSLADSVAVYVTA